jgi:CO/xanthine dehydrogenase FAD-binding subunit
VLEQVFAPTSLDEALGLMSVAGTRPLAGGTDLVVSERVGRRPFPKALVNLAGLDELRGIDQADDALAVGAMCSYEELLRRERVAGDFSALSDAAAMVGSPATRHSGTLGGNLANGSPAMDSGSPLLVLGARVELASQRGRRVLDVDQFLIGPGETALGPDELLVSVTLPHLPRRGSAYIRLEYRRAMEIAVVGAAAAVVLGPDGRVADLAIALTAVAPRCVRVDGLGALACGQAPSAALIDVCAERSLAAVRAIDDVRASASYRRAMVPVIVRRALRRALDRAPTGTSATIWQTEGAAGDPAPAA